MKTVPEGAVLGAGRTGSWRDLIRASDVLRLQFAYGST